MNKYAMFLKFSIQKLRIISLQSISLNIQEELLTFKLKNKEKKTIQIVIFPHL